jgi:dTDP-4-amino-4,6-dideoxygalactose transaminase
MPRVLSPCAILATFEESEQIMTAMPLPQRYLTVRMNDLDAQYQQIKGEVDGALAQVMQEQSFVLGPQVQRFEADFANYCKVGHCIGVSSGTDALVLALLAAGVGEGDEVIAPALTFGATIEAICQVGARPVLCDIDPTHYTIDPEQVRRCLSDRTRAIVPVHLYGQVADMDGLSVLAAERDLVLVEDAAQAQGARYRSEPAGSLGRVGCFSFYPGKNLGAYGDAGGITTDDDVLAERLRRLRNHGQVSGDKFNYREIGYNARMDGFQGAVLSAKLPHLNDWNERRRSIATRYRTELGDLECIAQPVEAQHVHHVYHLYVIRTPDRDNLASSLRAAGVEATVHYPHPMHLTPAFRLLGNGEGSLPVSEQVCREILSLPLYPEMSDEQIDWVIDAVWRHYT